MEAARERLPSLPGISSHARERMVDHCGFDPGEEAWMAAVLAIYERRALLLAKQDHGVEVYALSIAGFPIKAVYKPLGGLILTVLPPDAILGRQARAAAPQQTNLSRQESRKAWRRANRAGRGA